MERTTHGVVVAVDLPRSALGAEKGKDDENAIVEKDANNMEQDKVQPAKREKDSDLIQLKEINAELMRQVEKLQAQKEKLEQQVAVLSEGTAYI